MYELYRGLYKASGMPLARLDRVSKGSSMHGACWLSAGTGGVRRPERTETHSDQSKES